MILGAGFKIFGLLLSSATLPWEQVQASSSCTCTTGILPIHVDILIPKDPNSPLGGFNLTRSEKRSLVAEYGIYGVLCEPLVDQHPSAFKNCASFDMTSCSGTYPVSTFSNYSYTAFACENGVSSFAYDLLGSGHSSRPVNASDVQLPTLAYISSQIGVSMKNPASSFYSLFRPRRSFDKVVGVGHSLGSVTLNYGAIVDGERSPFDGLILTGWLHNRVTSDQFILPPAREVDPLQWGDLDPNYVTTRTLADRSVSYPSDPTLFSAQFLAFDELTKDVGSQFCPLQILSVGQPAKGFSGPVVEMVGSQDPGFCGGVESCKDPDAILGVEREFFPDSVRVDVRVIDGSGHGLNLGFNARESWNEILSLVIEFSNNK